MPLPEMEQSDDKCLPYKGDAIVGTLYALGCQFINFINEPTLVICLRFRQWFFGPKL